MRRVLVIGAGGSGKTTTKGMSTGEPSRQRFRTAQSDGCFGAVGIGMLITALSFLLTWAAVPAMMGEQKRAFSRDGFFFATPEIAQHFKWSAVQRVVETDEFLLLFVAPAAAHYIPKRAIPVESETPLRALLANVFADRPKRLLLQAWAD